MADTDPRRKDDGNEDSKKKEKWLHPEPLHLRPLPEPEAMGEPEALHPEGLKLEHVGDEEQDEDES